MRKDRATPIEIQANLSDGEVAAESPSSRVNYTDLR